MRLPNNGILILLASMMAGNGFAANPPRTFQARLTGNEEVPPVGGTRTVAQAMFRFNPGFTRLTFTFRLRKGLDITEVHLHCGPRGSNGPIVLPLFGLIGPASAPLLNSLAGGMNGTVEVSATLTSASLNPSAACGSNMAGSLNTLSGLARAMRNQQIFINAHSLTGQAGIIRGQVRMSATPVISDGSNNAGGGGASGY